MESNDHQRWARVPPGMAWKRPGLPRGWVRLFEANPDPTIGTLTGYGWIETPAKLLHVRLDWLEIRDTLPDEAE